METCRSKEEPMIRSRSRTSFAIRVICAAMLAAPALYCGTSAVRAKDDGRYAQSPLKPWFDSLKSKKGFCCSVADGQETEYEMRDNHYWAPIDGVWQPVPDEALITEPNKVGRAMKWILM